MELGERTTNGCRNCGGTTDPAHPDMCCTCFGICFGEPDHREEHLAYAMTDQDSEVVGPQAEGR